jgi:hypothetical protein
MSEPITPLTPAQTVTEEAQAAGENPIMRDLVGVDILASELTGGPMDETISTRLAIDSVEGHGISKEVGKIGSELLDKLQPDHGADAAAGDLARAKEEQTIVEQSGIIAGGAS